ncbi:hypothetical protein PMAYCL1PPCAC_24150, partial [Pristionchus mayeri]
VTCNGDDSEVHDIWIVESGGEQALLHPARKGERSLRNGSLSFDSWEGEAESVNVLSTRRKDTRDTYADFVFVVKSKGRIGVLATIQ